MAAEPTHNAIARIVEKLAGELHGLAFDIAEAGITPSVQARGDGIADAVLATMHGDAGDH